jgi:hypothetical protein
MHIFTKGKAKSDAHNNDVLVKLGYIPVATMKVHENNR